MPAAFERLDYTAMGSAVSAPSVSISTPSAGDVLVCFVAVDGNVVVDHIRDQNGDDFTIVEFDSSINQAGAVAYKVADGDETSIVATLDRTKTGMVAVAQYSGLDGTPLDASNDDIASVSATIISKLLTTPVPTSQPGLAVYAWINNQTRRWDSGDSVVVSGATRRDYTGGSFSYDESDTLAGVIIADEPYTATVAQTATISTGTSGSSIYGATLLFKEAVGGSGSTGNIAATEVGTDSSAISGSTSTIGSVVATEVGLDASSVAGTVHVSGTLSVNEIGSDSASVVGSVDVAGTLSATEQGADSSAITGQQQSAGSISVTETGPDAASISGTVNIVASLSSAESGTDSAIVSGTLSIVGQLAATETGADIAALIGAGNVPITGTLDAHEVGFDGAGILGTVEIAGILASVELGSDSATISGSVVQSGAIDVTEAGTDAAVLSGAVAIDCFLSTIEQGQDSGDIQSPVTTITGSIAAVESGSDSADIRQTDSACATWIPVAPAQKRAIDAVMRRFGEDVTFTDLALTVKAVFKRSDGTVPGGGIRPGMGREALMIRSADICPYRIDQGDPVKIRTADYQVIEIDPGLHGTTHYSVRRVQ